MGQKTRREGRITRHRRVRKKIFGTAERPRLAVYRSLRHIAAQVIDDTTGKTLCSVTTASKEFKSSQGSTGNIEAAAEAGKILAEKMKQAGVEAVVFDRGGYLYHGRIKAFAESAREAGIQF